jgi:hypothetical protein
MRLRTVFVFCTAMCACNVANTSDDPKSTGQSVDDDGSAPPEDAGNARCEWPKTLDKPDAYSTACFAMATYDICETVDGSTHCGINACTTDEYAVTCGGPGPATPPPLPAGCRPVVSGPGGNNAGCCPCGAGSS